MKLVLLFTILFFQMHSAQNLTDYRALLKSGETSEVAAKSLITKSETAFKSTNQPIYKGFSAIGNFLMAKHVFSPFKKMSYFNTGKSQLEKALKDEPKNLELRLMRLITQENIPKLLNYNQNITEDRNFLKLEYKNTNDQNLKIYIKEYLKI